jgi:hypothetical protein
MRRCRAGKGTNRYNARNVALRYTFNGNVMTQSADDQQGFADALHMLLEQQRSAMQTILALSENASRHDAESARAALAGIFEAAEKCHATYRDVLVEVLASHRVG